MSIFNRISDILKAYNNDLPKLLGLMKEMNGGM